MTEIRLNPADPEIEELFQLLKLKDTRARLRQLIHNEMRMREGEDYHEAGGYLDISVDFLEDGCASRLFEKTFVGFDRGFVESRLKNFRIYAIITNGYVDNYEINLEYDFGDHSRPCVGELILNSDDAFNVKDAMLYFDDSAGEQLVSYWILRSSG